MAQPENYFPWDEIPDSNILPTGFYLLKINEVEDTESQNTGNRMFVGSFQVEEPVQFKGMFTKRDYYVVGTEEAPKSVVSGTMGARSFKGLLNGCQVPQSSDIEKLLHGLKGGKVIARIVQFTVTEDKGYKGQEDNKFASFHKIGEREVGLDDDGTLKGARPQVIAARPPVAGGAPPPPAADSAGQMAPPCPTCHKIMPILEYGPHVVDCKG
jgi:hypothetical protein